MTDLKALREMAEKYSKVKDSGCVAVSVESVVAFANAVLAFTEPEKPKEPRKKSGIELAARNVAQYYFDVCYPNGICTTTDVISSSLWSAFNMFANKLSEITGTEGVSPDDAPPPEQKQEKPREWWVNEYEGPRGVYVANAMWKTKDEAMGYSNSSWRRCIRVREWKEGE